MAEIGAGAAADKFEILVDRKSDLGKRIQVSLDFLCKNSTNLQEVLVQLLSNNVLSQHESQIVEHKESNYDRFRQLFTFMIAKLSRGDNSQHFVDALQQSGNEHILGELKSAVVTTDFAQGSQDASSQSIRFNVREPVPSFFGRENFLLDLDQQILQIHRTAADVPTTSMILSRICVVTGLGGIGKTETTRKYIHSYGHCFQHVVWIDAEKYHTAENQFRRLAIELQLRSKDFDVILKDVYDRLCTNDTLLVFDNAEAFEDNDPQRNGITRFLPKHMPLTHGKLVVLITSRHQDWIDLHTMPLPLWTPQESSEFLFHQLNMDESDANRKDATTLSETFGGLPLALQTAVAVIRQESKWNELMGKDGYTIQDLLRDYNNEGKREVLKKRPPGSPNATPLILLWKVSLDKIRKQPHGYLAIHILNVTAHLSPTNIPKELIFFIFSSNEEKNLRGALKLLVDCSFVKKFHAYISIHRMLQDVTIAHLEASTEKHSQNWFMNLRIWSFLTSRRRSRSTPSISRITTGMMEYMPTVQKSSKVYDAVHDNLVHVTMSHVLPNAQNLLETNFRFIKFIEFVFEEIQETRWVEAEKCCRVLINYSTSLVRFKSTSVTDDKFVHYYKMQLAWILRDMGKYKEAVDICQEILSSFNSLEDQEDVMPLILDTKHHLASILGSQGEHEEAAKLLYSVLDLCSKLHGPTHELTLATKNNLASALKNSGRVSEAKTLHAEILEVKMKDLGPLHLDTLTTKYAMAMILYEEGRYNDALKMHREVAEVREKELGLLHAQTLSSNSCMANVLQKQGKHEDALRIYADVIGRYEKASAASHPDCLLVKNNMAISLEDQGRLDKAKEMFCHVLDIEERLLGPSHIHTLNTKHNVAWVLMKQGKHIEALKLFQEVLELRTKQLGPVHTLTLVTNQNIGWLHLKMRNFEKAGRIANEVLAATQATLFKDYPDWKDTKHSWASILHSQGDYEEAIRLLSSVIFLRSKLHRKSTLATKHNNALIILDEGRYDEALEMLQEVAEGQESELGSLHAETLNSNCNMAGVLAKQGKYDDALQIYESVVSKYEKLSTASHPSCLIVKNNVALILGKQGKFEDAKEMLRQVMDMQECLLGPNHEDTINTKDSMAEVLAEEGKHADALKLYEEVLELQTKQLGHMHPDALQTNNCIGWLHVKMGNFDKAESIAKEVLAARQATLTSDHPDIKDTEKLYNKACLQNGS